MKNAEPIRRDTVAELEARQARGESRTDLACVHARTEADLERDIAADPDWHDIPRTWHEAAKAVMPVPKKLLSLRLDTDVVDWFRRQGSGYQMRINAVLRAFVAERGRKAD